MPIRVDAYTAGGVASGVLARSGHARDALEGASSLLLERVRWQAIDGVASSAAGEVSIAVDDILIAIADDDPTVPVHAAWHPIRLEVGPYLVEGELPTLPGFDPGRALTRPTGEFVLLRDVRISLLANPAVGGPANGVALVNRYGVERVTAELMLGFFFPGAAMDGLEAAPAGPVA